MRTLTVSSSKIKTYMECPALYYWRYVAKRPEKSAKSASVKLAKDGNLSQVVTSARQDVKIEQEPGAIFDSGKLVHRVLEIAARKRITNATCDKKVTKKELLTLLESVASEPPPDNDWERPVAITPETVESAAKVLALCWKSISFPHTIMVEKAFDVPIGSVEDDRGNIVVEEVRLNGVIDRIDKLPNGHIKIVDYKSGWSVMSRAEAELDPQINFYLVVGKLLFPKAEIDMELRYLNRGSRLGPVHYTESRKDWLLNAYVKPIIARMETWSKYPETPGSPHCYSCPRKAECASFASMVKGSLAPAGVDMGKNLELYERLGDIEGNIEKLKDQIKPYINAAVEKAEDGEVFAGNHRARVIFRNMTAYHDLKGTALAAAKAIIDAKKPSQPPVLPEPPADYEALKTAFMKLAAENARLKSMSMESSMAFEVAGKIAKAQAGLVNDFVEALPEDVTLQVAQAIEPTSTNAGYYTLEVERIAIPFHDRRPTVAQVKDAEEQEALRKRIPMGSKPVFDDAHEKIVEAVVVGTTPAISPPEQVAAELQVTVEATSAEEEPPAVAQAVATPAGAPTVVDETMDLFASVPESKRSDPGYVADPDAKDDGVSIEEVKEATSAAWAQADRKACDGSGLNSHGNPCTPCVSRSGKIGAGA